MAKAKTQEKPKTSQSTFFYVRIGAPTESMLEELKRAANSDFNARSCITPNSQLCKSSSTPKSDDSKYCFWLSIGFAKEKERRKFAKWVQEKKKNVSCWELD